MSRLIQITYVDQESSPGSPSRAYLRYDRKRFEYILTKHQEEVSESNSIWTHILEASLWIEPLCVMALTAVLLVRGNLIGAIFVSLLGSSSAFLLGVVSAFVMSRSSEWFRVVPTAKKDGLAIKDIIGTFDSSAESLNPHDRDTYSTALIEKFRMQGLRIP
jgi:hypothetical protein